MKKQSRLNLNLASRPIRNRRLFFVLFISLGLLFLIISIAGGTVYLNFREKAKSVRASINETDEENRKLQREETRYSAQIEKFSLAHQKKIDLINSMIYKKSFSWVGLLSTLEEILPASCFIVSLAPAYEGDFKMGVRLRMASPGRESLYKFIEGLNTAHFTEIRLISETQAPNGLFLFDMAIRYERNI